MWPPVPGWGLRRLADAPGVPAGTVTEHRAVRAGCGVFDVSHMGNLTIRAADDEVNRLLTNDISGLAAGDVQYTMMCDASGGVIDDMLVTRMTDGRLEIVPNAANTPAVGPWSR